MTTDVGHRALRRAGLVTACISLAAPRVTATQEPVEPPPPAPAGVTFRIPLASLVVPGIGQYRRGDYAAGAAFTGTALAGLGIYLTGDPDQLTLSSGLPRDNGGQRAFLGLQLIGAAGGVSAYDAFLGALPLLQPHGEYDFMTAPAGTGALFTAPFDPEFLTRWTTWIGLAYTGAVTAALAILESDPGARYEPFLARDAVFITGLSANAGIGEEALFRGWVYPVLHQQLNRRLWLSNGIQSAIFGALHPQAGPFAVVIGGWAFYQGWLTKRNGWNVRESIFQHFWYDIAVGVATLLTDRQSRAAVTFPTLRF